MLKPLAFLVFLAVAGQALAGSPTTIASTGNNDIVADISAQSGTCNDASGNGNNCINSTSLTTTTVGGHPAWTLDGSTANYFIINDGRTVSGLGQGYYGGPNFGFTPPQGDWSAIFVVDANASMDGTSVYALMGSGRTGTTNWVFGIHSGTPFWAPANCAFYDSWSSLTTGTIHVISFAWSGALQKVSVAVDGGAWSDSSYVGHTQTGNYSAASTDGTLMIGGTPSDHACGAVVKPYYGHLLRFILYKESLATTGKATLWAARVAALKHQFGVP